MGLINVLFTCLVLYLHLHFALPSAVEDDKNWDLLIFTQQWPVTVCKEWKDRNPAHTCTLPSKQNIWTVHGIWPTKLGTIGPEFCNRSWHFDPELIKPIEDQMEALWTNVEGQTSTYSLWSHEWSKHGTCAAVLEPLNNEYKYFSKGLEWEQKYKLSNLLESKQIVPSNDNEYQVVDIHNAIHSNLGVNPAIECRQEKGGLNWIVEIRLCHDKNLELINCDGIKESYNQLVYHAGEMVTVITNCDMSQGIVYPRLLNRTLLDMFYFVSWLRWFTW